MGKAEKRARKKRLIKKKESLLKRAREHIEKAETQKGSKDTTPGYWREEAIRFEEQAKEVGEVLEKLGNSTEDKISTEEK